MCAFLKECIKIKLVVSLRSLLARRCLHLANSPGNCYIGLLWLRSFTTAQGAGRNTIRQASTQGGQDRVANLARAPGTGQGNKEVVRCKVPGAQYKDIDWFHSVVDPLYIPEASQCQASLAHTIHSYYCCCCFTAPLQNVAKRWYRKLTMFVVPRAKIQPICHQLKVNVI